MIGLRAGRMVERAPQGGSIVEIRRLASPRFFGLWRVAS
jgi:hypothetical protein